MLAVQDSRISYDGEFYVSECVKCGHKLSSKTKGSIRRTLNNGYCRKCVPHYRAADAPKNAAGKWISHCPKCGKEQAYTRPDHAKSSERQGWMCKPCSSSSNNAHVGAEKRLYNKFRKSANTRKIYWGITFEDFTRCYTKKCALTGWDLSMEYGNCTASFDRIDSNLGYTPENIQWVHSMVNMCKNKYTQEKFIAMCKAVADKVKW
jgi:RNase P subunit RPR2